MCACDLSIESRRVNLNVICRVECKAKKASLGPACPFCAPVLCRSVCRHHCASTHLFCWYYARALLLFSGTKKKGYIVRRLRITVRQLQTTNNGKGQKKNLCSGRHMELLKHQLRACLFYRQHAGRQKSRSIDSLCPDTVPCIALYLVTIDQAFFVSGCGKGPLGPAPPSVDPLRRGSDGWANRGVSNRMVEAQSIFLTLRFVPSSHYCHIETCMRKHSR